MANVRIAAPDAPKIVPAFVVRKLEGKVEHTLITYRPDPDDRERNIREEKVVMEDAGFLVSFPIKRASIRVRTEQELKWLGFDQTIELVSEDENDDRVHGYADNPVAAATKSK